MLTPERREALRIGSRKYSMCIVVSSALRELLDAADELDQLRTLMVERDRLAAAVERIRALADGWQSRGEHLGAYSKMPEVPGDIADALFDGGAEFVERARQVRRALGPEDSRLPQKDLVRTKPTAN